VALDCRHQTTLLALRDRVLAAPRVVRLRQRYARELVWLRHASHRGNTWAYISRSASLLLLGFSGYLVV